MDREDFRAFIHFKKKMAERKEELSSLYQIHDYLAFAPANQNYRVIAKAKSEQELEESLRKLGIASWPEITIGRLDEILNQEVSEVDMGGPEK